MKGAVNMSPRTGRPPKNGTSRTGRSLNLRLTEDELNAIQSIAEYFDITRTDAVVESIRYLQRDIDEEEGGLSLVTYIEREREEFCEAATERLRVESEESILEELEQFELEELEYFESETLAKMEEWAEENEKEFDREAAIEEFKAGELQELLEKEKNKIEKRYDKNIENAVEEEWKIEIHFSRSRYFGINR